MVVVCWQPRLGPKPFTPPKLSFGADGDVKEMTKFCFDKVFSVPPVPGQDAGSVLGRRGSFTVSGDEVTPPLLEKPPATPPLHSPVAEREANTTELSNCEPHKDHVSSMGPELNNSDVHKDPEFNDTDQHKDLDPNTDESVEDLERAAMQRMSIAERRRRYENRSISAQDCGAPTTSPPRLRRHDSFKSARSPVTEMEPDGLEIVPTTTPKRTSTVFGESFYTCILHICLLLFSHFFYTACKCSCIH
ncbi:hypothetical protein PR048_024344 [Dryococelus australis]|uniref:Uncharacterized protein n=1 Tax=Dryococelus australis TaxID=614101 RepID=A0ABQ9GNC8_9NEOP|nr:hypothetical protein PR048_024344 [Dryococelus australis]